VTFVLDPALPVLLRPDGAVQVGWDPRRAVLVRPPSGLSAAAMATVLRAMAVPTELTELHRLALRHGLEDEAGFDDVVYALLAVMWVHNTLQWMVLRVIDSFGPALSAADKATYLDEQVIAAKLTGLSVVT